MALPFFACQIQSILNSFSKDTSTFHEYSSKFIQLLAANRNTEQLSLAAGLFLCKAIDSPDLSSVYARLAQVVTKHSEPPQLAVSFCQELLSHYDRILKQQVSPQKNEAVEEVKRLPARRMRRTFTVARFLGELYKVGVITHEKVQEYTLRSLDCHNEEAYEYICALLTTCGQQLERSSMDLSSSATKICEECIQNGGEGDLREGFPMPALFAKLKELSKETCKVEQEDAIRELIEKYTVALKPKDSVDCELMKMALSERSNSPGLCSGNQTVFCRMCAHSRESSDRLRTEILLFHSQIKYQRGCTGKEDQSSIINGSNSLEALRPQMWNDFLVNVPAFVALFKSGFCSAEVMVDCIELLLNSGIEANHTHLISLVEAVTPELLDLENLAIESGYLPKQHYAPPEGWLGSVYDRVDKLSSDTTLSLKTRLALRGLARKRNRCKADQASMKSYTPSSDTAPIPTIATNSSLTPTTATVFEGNLGIGSNIAALNDASSTEKTVSLDSSISDERLRLNHATRNKAANADDAQNSQSETSKTLQAPTANVQSARMPAKPVATGDSVAPSVETQLDSLTYLHNPRIGRETTRLKSKVDNSIADLIKTGNRKRNHFEMSFNQNHRTPMNHRQLQNQRSGRGSMDWRRGPMGQPIMHPGLRMGMRGHQRSVVQSLAIPPTSPSRVRQLAPRVELARDPNAWRPNRRAGGGGREQKESSDDTEKIPAEKQAEAIVKLTRGILNKLTPENFDKLCEKFLRLDLNERQDRISAVIKFVFEKAIDEPSFSMVYAQMVHHVCQHSQETAKKFRKEILDQCQKEFQKTNMDEDEIEKKKKEIEGAPADKKEVLKLELEEFRTRMRRRSLGNVRFIGELFKLQMLTPKILVDCVQMLLGNQDEESYECLCTLLMIVGQKLDNTLKDVENRVREAKVRGGPMPKFIPEDSYMDKTFKRLKTFSSDQKLSFRIRFVLLDLVELREMKWVPRRPSSAPKKIDEIRRDAIQEAQEQTTFAEALLDTSPTHLGGQRCSDSVNQNESTQMKECYCNSVPSAETIRFSQGKKPRHLKTKTRWRNQGPPTPAALHLSPADLQAIVKRNFEEYLSDRNLKDTLFWIYTRFPGNHILVFIDKLTKEVAEMSKEHEHIGAAKLVKMLIRHKCVQRSQVIDTIAKGVIPDIPDIQLDFPRAMMYVAKFVLELFADDTSLDWLMELSKPMKWVWENSYVEFISSIQDLFLLKFF